MYTYNGTIVRVIDGDSVWIEVDVGFHMSYKYNFRLGGINTPELRSSDPIEKAKAYDAKARLEELLPKGADVTVHTGKPGKYGRWIAEIIIPDGHGGNGLSVNTILLEEGHAVVY